MLVGGRWSFVVGKPWTRPLVLFPIHQLIPSPVDPGISRSFEIIVLGENFRQIFGFKGLICKMFRSKELAFVRCSSLLWNVLLMGNTRLTTPIQDPIFRAWSSGAQ